jgi:ADP-heptose:LPS heptosyltransferase
MWRSGTPLTPLLVGALALTDFILGNMMAWTDSRLDDAKRCQSIGYPNSWSQVTRILALRLDNLGDVIMTGPALRAIKETLPQVHLTLLASPSGAQAAALLPWIDRVLSWRVLWQDLGQPPLDPAREWQLIATLQECQFDAAIIFTSFSQSPYPAGFVCQLAGIPLRLGESAEADPFSLTTTVQFAAQELHQVERNLQLIEAVGFQVSDRHLCIKIPEAVNAAVTQLLSQHGLAPEAPFLLLNPWTSCQSRTYSGERFAIACRGLAELTHLPVVVTGVEKDRSYCTTVLKILGKWAIDLVGKTTFAELADLIARAKLVISNNTSAMHLADATQTPSVILFSGTELESQWRPRNSPTHLLRQPTSCSPCYAFTCPYDLECLDISPEYIVDAGLQLLGYSI